MRKSWLLLGIFPGLSMPPYLGESSLTPLLASKICICASSFPKDDVTNLQRLCWDRIGIRDAAMYQCTWAVGAFLGNSECVALDHLLASHKLSKGTSRREESLRETMSPRHCPLASESQDFQIEF